MILTDYEQNILANVADYGCFITSVSGDEENPPFTYSVGFWETVGAPEVIIVGLPGKLAASIINILCDMLKEHTAEIHDGLVIEGLLEGYACVARRVHPTQVGREFFNSALWYHELRTGQPLTNAYQIIWPSVGEGLYPWDEGCPADIIDLQPALYLPKVEA